MARNERSEARFFRRMLWVTCATGLLPALLLQQATGMMSLRLLAFAGVSGACCGFYYIFLTLAYKAADFSVVYPIARAAPVVVLAGIDVLRRRPPSASGWLGMALVILGCLLAPHVRLRDASWRAYADRALLWVGLTAMGTVAYTMLDKLAAEQATGGVGFALLYGYAFFAASGVTYELLLRITSIGRQEPHSSDWGWPATAAAMNYGAYALVLWAYQMCERASYIVACRQFSIVVGVVLAFVIYHERGVWTRLTACALITVGLVLIATGS